MSACSATASKTVSQSPGDPTSIVCNLCNKKFGDLTALHQHKQDSHSLSTCTNCRETFGSIKAFFQHQNDNHVTFFCSICHGVFGNQKELLQHKESTHKVACSLCAREFKSQNSLYRHITCKHSLYCHLCSEVFTSVEVLAKHKADPNIHKFLCNICNRVFPNQEELTKHTEKCQPTQGTVGDAAEDIQNSLSHCGFCKETFSCPRALTQHHIMKHRLFCNICDEEFSGQQAFADHQAEVHKLKMLQCTRCGALFEDLHAKLSHEKAGHKQCAVCQKLLSSDSEHAAHMRDVHKLWCQLCKCAFNDEARLTKHNKKIHNCDVCSEIFPSSTLLADHKYQKHNVSSDTKALEMHCTELKPSQVSSMKSSSVEDDTSATGTEQVPSHVPSPLPATTSQEPVLPQVSSVLCTPVQTSSKTLLQECKPPESLSTQSSPSQPVSVQDQSSKPTPLAANSKLVPSDNAVSPTTSTKSSSTELTSEQTAMTVKQEISLQQHCKDKHSSDAPTANQKCGHCGQTFNSTTALCEHSSRAHGGSSALASHTNPDLPNVTSTLGETSNDGKELQQNCEDKNSGRSETPVSRSSSGLLDGNSELREHCSSQRSSSPSFQGVSSSSNLSLLSNLSELQQQNLKKSGSANLSNLYGSSLSNKCEVEQRYRDDQRVGTSVPPTIQCSQCGVCFSDKSELQQHIKRQHCVPPKRTIQCSRDEASLSENKLQRRDDECRDSGSPNLCTASGPSPGDRNPVQQHSRRKHKTMAQLMCSRCRKTFKDPKSLEQHQRDKHGFSLPGDDSSVLNTDSLCLCQVCWRVFKHQDDLNQHVRAMHPGDLMALGSSVHQMITYAYFTKIGSLLQQNPCNLCHYMDLHLQPTEEYNDGISSVITELVNCLQGYTKISRYIKGGSFGQGTHLVNASDVTVVLFLEEFHSMADMETNLWDKVQGIKKYLSSDWPRCSCEFEVEAVTLCSLKLRSKPSASLLCAIELMPAYDVFGSFPSEDRKEGVFSKMIEESPSERKYYSAVSTQLRVKFFQELPPRVKDLIRLVKHWQDCHLPARTWRLQNQNSISSYALELITVDAWEDVGEPLRFSLVQGFKAVLQRLVDYRDIDVEWYDHYSEEMAEKIRQNGYLVFASNSPVVVDPGNPAINVCADCNQWDELARTAAESLQQPLLQGTAIKTDWVE